MGRIKETGIVENTRFNFLSDLRRSLLKIKSKKSFFYAWFY